MFVGIQRTIKDNIFSFKFDHNMESPLQSNHINNSIASSKRRGKILNPSHSLDFCHFNKIDIPEKCFNL